MKWRDKFRCTTYSNNNSFLSPFNHQKKRDNKLRENKRQNELTISSTAGRVLGLCRRNGKSADMQDSTQDWISGS